MFLGLTTSKRRATFLIHSDNKCSRAVTSVELNMLVLGMRTGSFFWFAFFMFATLQYCTMYGIMAVAVTPNLMMAAVLSSAFYSVWNLFAGFIIPKPVRLLYFLSVLLFP